MDIKGIDGLTHEEVAQSVQRGARFVMYQYCVSVVFMTFKRPSSIHFIPAGQGTVGKGLPFSGISFLVGWWGIPWGPIYTIQSLWVNFRGGRDVTQEIMSSASSSAAAATAIPQAQRG